MVRIYAKDYEGNLKIPPMDGDDTDTSEKEGNTDDNTSSDSDTSTGDVEGDTSDSDKADIKDEHRKDDKLEMAFLSKKERRKVKRERFKEQWSGMSGKEKFIHFKEYYLWKVVFIAFLIVFAAFGIKLMKDNSRPVALSYAVLNSPNHYEVNTDALEALYREHYDLSDRYVFNCLLDVTMDPKTFDANYYADSNAPEYSSFPVHCANNYFDIIISDRKGIICAARKSRIHSFYMIFSEEDYEIVTSDKYKDKILMAVDYYGDEEEFAFDISGTEFAKSLNLGYDDVYIAFPGKSVENMNNIKMVLNYIFDMGLED